jgi:uncharacterized protein (DUF2147 family)
MFGKSKALAVSALLLCSVSGALANDVSPVGRWKTINDKTGAQDGLIEITQSGDELSGRIIKIIPQPGDDADGLCHKCDGAEKNQPIVGMTILRGFKRDGDEWNGGTILDPRSGDVYSSEMHLDESGKKLFVRGYIGISLLGRTTTWIRDEAGSCAARPCE